MRQCRFETLPLGRTTSFPWTRPMVTSFLSNVSCLGSPPFSVRVRITMGKDAMPKDFPCPFRPLRRGARRPRRSAVTSPSEAARSRRVVARAGWRSDRETRWLRRVAPAAPSPRSPPRLNDPGKYRCRSRGGIIPIGRHWMTTPKRRTIVLATALAVLPAVGVSAATRPAKRPRYYFKIVEVNVGKLNDPGLEESARELLGKELAARPEFTADVQAGSDEALEEELKRRKLRGFLVSLRIDELAKDLKPPRPGGRLKQLAVGTRLSVFGTTFPGEKLAFGGDGEAVVEA